MKQSEAKFDIGQVIKHCISSKRGIVFDVELGYSKDEEILNQIPKEHRPKKDQPYYCILPELKTEAKQDHFGVLEYVPEEVLLDDNEGEVINPLLETFYHPEMIKERYRLRALPH